MGDLAEDDGGTSDLLKQVEAYCAKHEVAESTLGRLAVNDGKLIGRLRAGGTLTLRTMNKLTSFMQHPPYEQPAPAEAAL